MKTEFKTALVYLADEIYLKSQLSLPNISYYEDFPQIENGVGELRMMLNQFDTHYKKIPKSLNKSYKISWVMGTLISEVMEKSIISKLNQIKNLTVEPIKVKNRFYGDSITVSGLLVGKDIYNTLRKRKLGDTVFLPPLHQIYL